MPDIARASARRRLYLMLEPTAWPRAGLSPLNRAVVLLILVSVAGAVLESEPLLYEGRERFWFGLEVGFAFIFVVEYLARLWICVESPSYRGAVRGRLAYAFSPAALLDLIAVVPLIFAFAGTEAFLLRFFRMARILRLARLGRFSLAMLALRDAIASRRYELLMSLCVAGVMLLVSSTLLYIVESDTQPAAFGSIPRAMWWSIATLTTVGYGDVFPVTVLGRILAGVTAVLGIGLIAMPTGILAAALSDALQKQRAEAGGNTAGK